MSDVITNGITVYDDDYVKFKYKQYCNLVKQKLHDHQKPHDRRYKQGFFVPTRPAKCGNIMATSEVQPIVCRSGWEKQFCEYCDETDSIIFWMSEPIKILYKNPIKNRMSFYVPDFVIHYLDKNKKLVKMMIEIKPLKEASLKEASNGYDRMMLAQNVMKWQSAIEYCKKRDYIFKVLTDNSFKL